MGGGRCVGRPSRGTRDQGRSGQGGFDDSYRLLVIDDLDGNQLFFTYPNEPAPGKIASDEAYSSSPAGSRDNSGGVTLQFP